MEMILQMWPQKCHIKRNNHFPQPDNYTCANAVPYQHLYQIHLIIQPNRKDVKYENRTVRQIIQYLPEEIKNML